ncbi:uncharacterized protein SPPG_00472 [Spizellomyces punctatus DAOM BR117]|uniref:alpha-glucosidase n=1 Tax=Spizellomyces punctatus (strain DAOM BR117) TaxID=645134 RepID=A0A0L0HV71_SPIPD|nr:uncharacterized protein SPPG_00472 [Spizellomyces punctatus DAOM BR117]KND04769.1 hypothetical protein SPPG_00472 [Spizellomyces punctatus DAOM BR117]|eukprot:XP_016612808.1 hypothetical protein SPPG_00472 [Spizellomyces punctatus DAOM BR117]
MRAARILSLILFAKATAGIPAIHQRDDANPSAALIDTSKCSGYSLSDASDTSVGRFSAKLSLSDQPCNAYGKDYPNLDITVEYQTRERLRVLIRDTPQENWFIPPEIVPIPKAENGEKNKSNLRFEYVAKPFGFKIIRVEDNEVIFDTTSHKLIYEDQYLEVTTSVPSHANIYGGSEFIGRFRRNEQSTTQALWARDVATPTEENIYGSHPMYMEMRKNKAHAVYLRNSNGMDFILRDGIVRYRTIGGVLDLTFFAPLGGNPNDVVAEYTKVISRPAMPAYWHLGFHQSRWGYKNITNLKWVMDNYRNANIPLETIWSDIDYMDKYRDFTLDPIQYPKELMTKFVKELHQTAQHFVVIVDPGISTNSTPYQRGLDAQVFMQNDATHTDEKHKYYIGQVWPGYTAFVDWFHPNASAYWTDEVSRFLDTLDVDGLWIDMNEPSSFCYGPCGLDAPDPAVFQPKTPFDLPGGDDFTPPDFLNASIEAARQGRPLPYSTLPRNLHKRAYKPMPIEQQLEPHYKINNKFANLSDHAVQTNATHWGGQDKPRISEVDVHNLYGHMWAIATRKALIAKRANKRPFVLSRSTFPSSGAHTYHWTGDNHATWEHLHYSVVGVLQFQMYGISMIGPDICGFNSNTTEELCNRWMSVGAYFPFMRNHNIRGTISQEAYIWNSVAEASRTHLRHRYSLLPYMYTHLYLSSAQGTPAWKALMYEFPTEAPTLWIDAQFLIGPALLVSPVVTEKATSVTAYMPKSRWYDFTTLIPINGQGRNMSFDAPLGHVPVHIRGGYVIPMQEPGYTTTESRKNPYSLIVALDEKGNAQGLLYLDDGESLNVDNHTSNISFQVSNGKMVADGTFGYQPNDLPKLTKLVILGSQPVQQVRVNDAQIMCQISYKADRGSVTIEGLAIELTERFTVEWGVGPMSFLSISSGTGIRKVDLGVMGMLLVFVASLWW